MPESLQLDQLWYTWSTSGLEAINSGYRVRAASDGLRDTQGMRYRRLDRYLRYDPPQGVNLSTFDVHTAPVSLAFIHNKDERLLVRKVFQGQDAAGRNSAYFIHLIAGLPETFTAREAISLWECPELWRESDALLPPQETLLPKIPYEYLLKCVRSARKNFALPMVTTQLKFLLQNILATQMPTHIEVTGQSSLIAALLYGLTYSLPMTFLPDLTFNTYEHKPEQSEVLFVGQTTLQELTGTAGLRVRTVPPSGLVEETITADFQQYIETTVQILLGGDAQMLQKLERIVRESERHPADKYELFTAFKLHFARNPLQPQQLSLLLKRPSDYPEVLMDPQRQEECVELFLSQFEAWSNELIGLKNSLGRQPATTQNVLLPFLRAIRDRLWGKLENLLQNPQGNAALMQQCSTLLDALILPADYQTFWYNLLLKDKLREPQIYATILSGKPVWLYPWFIQHALASTPASDFSVIQPWLAINSWSLLGALLGLHATARAQGHPLPVDWLYFAMQRPLQKISKDDLKIVRTCEPIFFERLEIQLQRQNRQENENVVYFFQHLLLYGYEKSTDFLIFILQRATGSQDLVTQLLALVAPRSEYALTPPVFAQILTTVGPELINLYGNTPILAEYIRQYILTLQPHYLNNEMTLQILHNLQTSRNLPEKINRLALAWCLLATFLQRQELKSEKLTEVSSAITTIVTLVVEETGQNISGTFSQMLLPRFAEWIGNEGELVLIVDAFDKLLAANRWDLLCLLAEEAGQRYHALDTFYRLSPYLAYGVQEGARKKKTQEEMNLYLRSLYGFASNDVLKRVENVTTSGFLPEVVQRRWSAWRKAEGANRGFWPGQKNRQVSPIELPPERKQFVALPGEQEYKVAGIGPGDTGIQRNTLVKINAYSTNISRLTYQQMASVFTPLAEFWTEKIFGGEKAIQLPDFEHKMFTTLIKELTTAPRDISPQLCQLLVDNVILENRSKETNQGLNPYVERYLKAFSIWAENKRRTGRQFPGFFDDDLKQGFTLLTRRYLVLKDLEEKHKNAQRWLDEARKKAHIDYLF